MEALVKEGILSNRSKQRLRIDPWKLSTDQSRRRETRRTTRRERQRGERETERRRRERQRGGERRSEKEGGWR